jgi:hypothetical protein
MNTTINLIFNIIHQYSKINLNKSRKRKRSFDFDENPRELKRLKIV